MRRASTLMNASGLAVERVIDSKWDVVKAVGEKLGVIELVSQEDWDSILAQLQEAQDFTGISVIAGDYAGYDPVSKVITVPTIKGDTGDTGLQGVQGIPGSRGPEGPRGLKGDKGESGTNGSNGRNGIDGLNGMVPVLEFILDAQGDLAYKVIRYEDGPAGQRFPIEEW